MLRNVHIWLADYLRQSSRRRKAFALPTHIFFCFVDHYEPLWRDASVEQANQRVRQWSENYPKLASQFRDADGRPPQHTFFFPAEQYRPEFLDPLAKLTAQGLGEVEIHLHHDNDTADGLRRSLEKFKTQLHSHGLLCSDRNGRMRYGFIHGNWALDNSRGDGRRCGVNNELQVLNETGCYADFTLPSAPSDTQTGKINSIYYAKDDPRAPKSHDWGVDARVGGNSVGDLLIVQGPLALNWRSRKWGLLPRIENAEVAHNAPPKRERVELWLRQRVGVAGRPDWNFVKVHTHGCQEQNFEVLLGERCRRMHEMLARDFNDGQRFVLHYVTAREVYNLIRAAQSGQRGAVAALRDYELARPPVCKSLR